MSKTRTIEIEDTLDDIVDNVKDELKDDFIDFLKENPETESFDDYEPHDRLVEIVDSNTPIYYSEIDGLYYLYGSELDEAYKNAGIGDGTEDNHRQITIYCYLEEKAWDYFRDLNEIFDEFIEQGIKAVIEEVK